MGQSRARRVDMGSRLSSLIEAMQAGVLVEDERGRIAVINREMCGIFGFVEEPADLTNRPAADLIDRIAETTRLPDDFRGRLHELTTRREPMRGEEIVLLDGRILERDYLPIWEDHFYSGHLWVYRDITRRKRMEIRLQVHREALAMLARSAPLTQVLETLLRGTERVEPGMLGSIHLYDPGTECLRDPIAPSLPKAYNQAVAVVPIGPSAGSCGTAAWRRDRVVVTDIASDALWAADPERALGHGLHACWSQPIFGYRKGLLGTLAMYYREPRAPGIHEVDLIESAAQIAGIAIEGSRAQSELASARDRALAAARAKSEFL
ncbi:MAG: GAF domain-containing protein, partial [Candidatus Eisenbacteria bacterium]|nr:GAF domain-containing protein [Candidatus Eisenbacteria bacterium]